MTKLLEKIKSILKNYFTLTDLKKIGILSEASLKVSINRLVKKKELFRLIRGVYTTDITTVDWEQLACEIYHPAYLSFEWVLAKYGILSQQPINLTLATSNPTKKIETVDNAIFYHHLQPDLFWGYEQKENILEATPEKALVDLAYLSLNGYAKFDVEEMNLKNINKKTIKQHLHKINYAKLIKLFSGVI